MKCVNCGHEQVSGKYCGKCGSSMESTSTPSAEAQQSATVESAPVQQQATPTQPNEHIEKVKQTSKLYISYSKEFLKHPSRIFQVKEQQFTNSIITIAIILALSAYTIYMAVKSIYKNTIGVASGVADIFTGGLASSLIPKIEFFPTFGKSFILLLIILAISVGITFAVTKFTKQQITFKQLVSIYGTLLLPVIGLVLVAFLSVLIGNVLFGLGFLVLAFAAAAYVYPIRILLTNFNGELKIEPTHRALIHFSGMSFVLYIIASQYIKKIMDQIGAIMQFIDML